MVLKKIVYISNSTIPSKTENSVHVMKIAEGDTVNRKSPACLEISMELLFTL